MKIDLTPMKLPINYEKADWQTRRMAREQYVLDQEGKCMFCSEPLDARAATKVSSKQINWDLFPPNFLDHPVHLQHCHNTGMTEGAVHAYCNAVMWQYHNR